MSVLLLPPELLCEVIESPLLDNRDVKNLRLVHQVFRDYAQRRLFSHISLHFKATHGNTRSLLAMSLRLLRFVKSSEKHLPRFIRSLMMLVEGDKGDGFTTFISASANRFFQHFRRIEHLKLDFAPAFHKQNNDCSNLAKLMSVISKYRLREQEPLEVIRFSLISNWKWLQDGPNMAAAGITDLKVLTHAVGHKFYYLGDETKARLEGLLQLSRQSIAGAIEGYDNLQHLDISSTDILITLDSIFGCLQKVEGTTHLRLRSLTLNENQLPTLEETIWKLKSLESLTINDGGINSRDPLRPQIQIWLKLHRAGIRLKNIAVPALSETLLSFVAKNSELISFTLLCNKVIIDGVAFDRGYLDQWANSRAQVSDTYRGASRKFLVMCSQLRHQTMPTLSYGLQRLTLMMSFHHWYRAVGLGTSRSGPRLRDFDSCIVKGCFTKAVSPGNPDEDKIVNINEGSLSGLDNLMSLIRGFLKLRVVEFVPVQIAQKDDPEKVEKSISEWGYRPPIGKGRDEMLWREGMILSIPWKEGILVDCKGKPWRKSEFVLNKGGSGIWRFTKVVSYW